MLEHTPSHWIGEIRPDVAEGITGQEIWTYNRSRTENLDPKLVHGLGGIQIKYGPEVYDPRQVDYIARERSVVNLAGPELAVLTTLPEVIAGASSCLGGSHDVTRGLQERLETGPEVEIWALPVNGIRPLGEDEL